MLGDVVVQAAGAVTLVDSRTQGDKATHLPSVHGSQQHWKWIFPA